VFVSNGKPGVFDHGDFKESNCDNDRQPEIALWPPKPEILYLTSTSSKNPRIAVGISTLYHSVFPAILQFPVVGRCRNHLGALSLTSLLSES